MRDARRPSGVLSRAKAKAKAKRKKKTRRAPTRRFARRAPRRRDRARVNVPTRQVDARARALGRGRFMFGSRMSAAQGRRPGLTSGIRRPMSVGPLGRCLSRRFFRARGRDGVSPSTGEVGVGTSRRAGLRGLKGRGREGAASRRTSRADPAVVRPASRVSSSERGAVVGGRFRSASSRGLEDANSEPVEVDEDDGGGQGDRHEQGVVPARIACAGGGTPASPPRERKKRHARALAARKHAAPRRSRNAPSARTRVSPRPSSNRQRRNCWRSRAPPESARMTEEDERARARARGLLPTPGTRRARGESAERAEVLDGTITHDRLGHPSLTRDEPAAAVDSKIVTHDEFLDPRFAASPSPPSNRTRRV